MPGRTRSKLLSRPARSTPALTPTQSPTLVETGSPLVGIIMGSQSDWETMQHAAALLTELGVPHECRVVSAHRTPDLLFFYASHAAGRGVEVIIAGAGGAAHLPGMCASKTHLPVLGVPVQSAALSGMDSLLSIVQMPAGIPVGTLAIGKAGAINAGLLATAILCGKHARFQQGYLDFRQRQTDRVLTDSNLSLPGTLDAGKARKKARAGSTAGVKR